MYSILFARAAQNPKTNHATDQPARQIASDKKGVIR